MGLSSGKPLEKYLIKGTWPLLHRRILIQKALQNAVMRTALTKRAMCHTFRLSSATYLFKSGYDIRTAQEHLGLYGINTMIIYNLILNLFALPLFILFTIMSLCNSRLRKTYLSRIGLKSILPPKKRPVWFHCSSLGEFNAIKNVILESQCNRDEESGGGWD